MRFVKMHGIQNDYVYVDAMTHPEIEQRDLPALARAISHRHTGVGSDGLILLCRPKTADAHVRMRMFNADGSESEMCGNGIRCVAKFAHDRLGIKAKPMRVETGAGILSIEHVSETGKLTHATVDMGEPITELRKIPVLSSEFAFTSEEPFHAGIGTEAEGWVGTFVSMGNPHAVIFEDGSTDYTPTALQQLDLRRIGPMIENHPAFPRRINAHFVAPLSRNEAVMRTWERGAGTTLACGTGACAVLVAGVLTDRLDRKALLHLPGGDLTIRWDENSNHVFMTGPATDVFEGEWPD